MYAYKYTYTSILLSVRRSIHVSVLSIKLIRVHNYKCTSGVYTSILFSVLTSALTSILNSVLTSTLIGVLKVDFCDFWSFIKSFTV